MKSIKDDVRSVFKSFHFAFRGLKFCILNERNMRIHLVILTLVIYFSILFGLTEGEWLALVLVSGIVLICEMLNTAVEALVNLETASYHNVARVAKDVAAGAVLFAAIIAVVVGCILFLKLDKLTALCCLIAANPLLLLPFAVLLIGGGLFVFLGFKLNKQ